MGSFWKHQQEKHEAWLKGFKDAERESHRASLAKNYAKGWEAGRSGQIGRIRQGAKKIGKAIDTISYASDRVVRDMFPEMENTRLGDEVFKTKRRR